MTDFDIQRSERRCSVTDRELAPGDEFYSVIVHRDEEVARVDYSTEAWSGPPDECIGWWKTQVPSLSSLKAKWAPSEVMLHYFESLADAEDKSDTRYVLSLLLLRRRIVRQVDIETDPGGIQTIVYHCSRNQKDYRVAMCDLDPARLDIIQADLAELLDAPSKG